MARRIPDRYTILIAQTDKEPLVFSFRPIVLFAMLGAIACLLLLPLVICSQKSKAPEPAAFQSR